MQEIYVENIKEVLRNKKRIETELEIKLSNKGKNVFINGKPENEFLALHVLEAVNAGFSVANSLQLKDENIISVENSVQFQAALDSSEPGDIIELQAGKSFTGPFILRKKDGDSWITIRTSKYKSLPEYGERILPSHKNLMPKIIAVIFTRSLSNNCFLGFSEKSLKRKV